MNTKIICTKVITSWMILSLGVLPAVSHAHDWSTWLSEVVPGVSIKASHMVDLQKAIRWDVDDLNNYNSNVYYNGAGNVGIGTNAPIAKLDVSLPSNTNFRTQYDTPNGFSGTNLNVNTAGGWARSHGFSSNEAIRGHLGAYGSNDNLIYLFLDARGVTSSPHSGAHFVLEPSGAVGIGDTSPDGTLKLDVAGPIGATQYCDANGANCTLAADLGGGGKFIDGTNPIHAVYNGGNVGIGTPSPAATLHVQGNAIVAGSLNASAIQVGGYVTANNQPLSPVHLANKAYVDGAVASSSGDTIPAGAVMPFNLASCPSGWTELTNARGRYLVGRPSGGTLLGTAGTALTNRENRAAGQHLHSVNPPNTNSTNTGGHDHPSTASTSAGGHNHPATSTGSGGSHGHSASTNNAGSHQHGKGVTLFTNGLGGGGVSSSGSNPTNFTNHAGLHGHTVTVSNSGSSHAHSVDLANIAGHTHATNIANVAGHVHATNIPAFNSANGGSGIAGTNAPYLQLLMCQKS